MKARKVEVKHVEPTHHRGAANHREVKTDATKTLGRYVTSEPSEPTAGHAELEPAKVDFFTRGGDHGPDRPGMSDRDWNPDDNSELESETH